MKPGNIVKLKIKVDTLEQGTKVEIARLIPWKEGVIDIKHESLKGYVRVNIEDLTKINSK